MLWKRLLTNQKQCTKCNKSINKFVARVKDSVSGRWKTKTVATLKLAKDIESKFKTEILEGNVFDKKKTGVIDFEVYIEHAKVHKISWKSDLSRWNRLVQDNDYQSRHRIEKILNKMKKDGYAPCTVHHMLKLIRRVYNWHIQNDLYFQAYTKYIIPTAGKCDGVFEPSHLMDF